MKTVKDKYLVVGADFAGYPLKEAVCAHLRAKGWKITDLGVVADAQIFVSTYDETTKEWSPIVKTVNNGDGTVTCTFEHLCAVAFSMPLAGTTVPVEDAPATNLLPWIIILVLAIVAFVVVVIIKNKKAA